MLLNDKGTYMINFTMLKTLFPVFLVFASLLISPQVEAENFVFLPRVTTGFMYYEYDVGTQGKTSEIKDSINLDEKLPFLGVGATVVSGKISVDAFFQTTTTEDFKEEGTFPVGADTVSYTRETEIDRQDYMFSFGYGMTRNLSFLVGYKYGNTSYDWTDSERDVNGENVGTALKENNFLAKGPFIGAAYALQIGRGMLALNAAAAMLDGKITTSRFHRPGDSSLVTLPGRERKEHVSLDTVGFTVGINWNAPITDRFSYGISLHASKYDFEAKSGIFRDSLYSDNRAHEILDLESFDVEEIVYSVNLSLSYRF